jgi:hypothetical protein
MSRRYGRNQKRAARQRIEALEREAANWKEGYHRDTTMLSLTLGRVRNELSNVRAALGPAFVGFAPEEIASHFRQATLEDEYSWNEAVADGHVRMQSLSYSCHERSDKPRHQLHFRVSLAGADVGYAISDPALQRAPADYVARAIAHELASMLVRDLRKAGAR